MEKSEREDGERSKEKVVDGILHNLESQLEAKGSKARQNTLLELLPLKILSRESENAKFIAREKGLEVLAGHGLWAETDEPALEALRCLANTLLLVPASRQTFVDLGFAPKVAAKLLDTETDDCEFLFSRILFLLTYETNLDFQGLVTSSKLDQAVLQNIERRATEASSQNAPSSQIKTLAIAETLKLLYNITHHYPSLSENFSTLVPLLLTILQKQVPLPNPPLEPPVGHIINVFLNLPLSSHTQALFPDATPALNVEKLTTILDGAVSAYSSPTIDSQGGSLISLLSMLYALAPPSVQDLMRRRLLPSEEERNQPLGLSDTLPGKLLRLSTTARTPELRDLVLGLMFDLSGREPSAFVKNVGYGYASGFLVNHNIATPAGVFPPNQSHSSTAAEGENVENSVEGGATQRRSDVNFVTGQYLADEPKDDEEPEMTEEEKLREAERLFVLFERLKMTGVVDVQNPVEAAARSGQLEELD